MPAPGRRPASTPAVAALVEAGVSFTRHAYQHDPHGTADRAGSYGGEAADALGVDPSRVLKTLLVDVDDELCVALVPVAGPLDLKALAAAVGGKRARMADPERAERATGYVVGGISPLGQKRRHRTVIDAGARRWSTVFVSAGRRGLEVELAADDLARLTDAVLAPIAG